MEVKKIILPYSDEAAQIKTITGWVSRLGHFFGEDEHLARYDGSTHRECRTCGEIIERNSYCKDCYEKSKLEAYSKRERREWNGTDALYSMTVDQYFFGAAELGDYCDSEDITIDSLNLIICDPCYAHALDPHDVYECDIPEDGEVPYILRELFDRLNKTIREEKIVLSWYPGEYAAIINMKEE